MVEALKIIASRFNLKAPDLEGIVEAQKEVMVVDASMCEDEGAVVAKLMMADGLNVRVTGYTVDGAKEAKSILCI